MNSFSRLFVLVALLLLPVVSVRAEDTRGFLARLFQPSANPAPGTGATLSAPIRPDPARTPGDTLEVSLEDIRTPGYSKRVRDVPVAVKRQVYASYGITHWNKGEYEVDHLIPLSIGGSNSTRNLWPQSYLTSPWNARAKDALELRLLKVVRSGQVDLKTAQHDIAADWIAAYQKYVGRQPRAAARQGAGPRFVPREGGSRRLDQDRDGQPDATDDRAAAGAGSVPAAPTQAQLGGDAQPDTTSSAPGGNAAPAAGQVWVNTRSGTIWRPGSRYFGKTREGRYMGEAEATAAGYHFAAGQ